MTTKDLILGDPRIAAALKKEREDKEKQLQKQKEKEKKEWVLMEKEEMMAAEREKMKKQDRKEKLLLSVVSTVTFVIFTIMHVTLSYDQYDITRMSAFNSAVTMASLP